MQIIVTAGQLIVVSSYFDYVRLRNHLRAEAADAFVGVCEYTEHPEAARRRTYFRQVRVVACHESDPDTCAVGQAYARIFPVAAVGCSMHSGTAHPTRHLVTMEDWGTGLAHEPCCVPTEGTS